MNLLVIRFSAMGDVALMTPAIIAVVSNHPNVQITLVTRGNFSPFFYNIPNVNVIGINLKKYRGFLGIFRLFNELNSLGPFHRIIDLHSSLRSRMISLFFRFKGVKNFNIIKGRKEKLKQIRKVRKELYKLPHTVERYLSVFAKAGFPSSVRKGPWINVDPESKLFASEYLKSIGLPVKNNLWIGLAPFAGHKLKEWPLENSRELIKLLKQEFTNCSVFLFGAKEEIPIMESLIDNEPSCFIVTGGKLGIKGELGIMEKIDVLIGMDSSNIHIAALMKKPVIALFGTTHPWSGFAPFGQEDSGILQVDLECRPCSIYGNTTCFRKDFACMVNITPENVIVRLKNILNINTLW